jgi:hypothetical protein
MQKHKTLVIDDTEYVMDKCYKQGMEAMAQNIPNNCNPYRFGSKSHDQWDYGHVNESCGYHKPLNKCVVKLQTSAWRDRTGIHWKQSLTFLRRQCSGFNLLEEDAGCIGVEDIIPKIINLRECSDGVYECIACNESRDWETGTIDDYDYKLVALTQTD